VRTSSWPGQLLTYLANTPANLGDQEHTLGTTRTLANPASENKSVGSQIPLDAHPLMVHNEGMATNEEFKVMNGTAVLRMTAKGTSVLEILPGFLPLQSINKVAR